MARGKAHIQVIGLTEFQRALKKADASLGPELRRAFNEVGELIVDEAEERMEPQFVLPAAERTGNLKKSLRALSTQREGRVVEGYEKRVPYAGWWEFGGNTKSPRGNTEREFVKEGRTLYPALRAKRDEIIQKLDEVLDRLWQIIEAR